MSVMEVQCADDIVYCKSRNFIVINFSTVHEVVHMLFSYGTSVLYCSQIQVYLCIDFSICIILV